MKKYILFAITVIIVLAMWIAYGNSAPEINEIYVSSENIPESFGGFRIAQVSDLHNAKFGKDNAKLVSLINEADADIIVITGDVVDSRKTDIDIAIDFAKRAVEIAPVYYVNGNHESRLEKSEYQYLTDGLENAGVNVLENDAVDISAGEDKITLVGIKDPGFKMEVVADNVQDNIAHQIMKIVSGNENYKVLLAHRPEFFDVYAGKVDLVMSGHAHGGQFIVPFVGGVVAPGQGFFPEYYDGLYEQNGTNMIVSRGIGNSIFPFRVNNRPVVVVAELVAK